MTRKNKTGTDYAKEAARAHTELCLFATVVTIMEGGNIKAKSQAAAQEIITLAQEEQQRCLHRYDVAIAKI